LILSQQFDRNRFLLSAPRTCLLVECHTLTDEQRLDVFGIV
jgi:hypothetical protein